MATLIHQLKGEFNDLIVYDDHVTLVYKKTLRMSFGAQRDFYYANLNSITFTERKKIFSGYITFNSIGDPDNPSALSWCNNRFYITLGYATNENAKVAYALIMEHFRAAKGWSAQDSEIISNHSAAAQLEFKKLLNEYLSSHESIDIHTEAKLFARAVELGTLKAPGSAIFCDFELMSITEVDGAYTVSGYVDSQNSYGALMRNNFTYHIRKTSQGWVCDDTFVDTETQVKKQVNSYLALWIILGILGTIVTGVITYFQFQSLF